MRLIIILAVAFISTLCGCGGENGEDGSGTDSTVVQLRTVSITGSIVSPSGDTFSPPPETGVVLYYWLPLDLYEEAQEDLLFLASIDSAFVPLPIQPDEESRNHAQRTVNNLEISLPVYLADSLAMRVIDSSILPFCMVKTPDGKEYMATGFGAPARLLDQLATGE